MDCSLQFAPSLTAAVAQLVESRIVIPVVVGSSPISHPIYKEITEIIFKKHDALFICAVNLLVN